jgi:hypothetical protein
MIYKAYPRLKRDSRFFQAQHATLNSDIDFDATPVFARLKASVQKGFQSQITVDCG